MLVLHHVHGMVLLQGDLFICGEAEGCFGAGSVTEMLSPVKISSIPAKLVVDIACGDGCSVGLIADNVSDVLLWESAQANASNLVNSSC